MGLHQISGPLMFTGNNTDGVMKHPNLAFLRIFINHFFYKCA